MGAGFSVLIQVLRARAMPGGEMRKEEERGGEMKRDEERKGGRKGGLSCWMLTEFKFCLRRCSKLEGAMVRSMSK